MPRRRARACSWPDLMSTQSPPRRLPYLLGAAVSAGALLVGRFLQPGHIPIPRCTFLRVTGYPCPFCGNTRSFLEAAKGAFSAAFLQAPLGVLVYAATWWVLGWCLYRSLRPAPSAPVHEKLPRALFYGVAGVVFACWLYRLAKGYR